MIRILTEKFPKQRYGGGWKGSEDNCCFRQTVNLIVMCSKILNHPSDKLGRCGITRPPLRVIFMLKIGKGKKPCFSKTPHP